MEHDPHRDHEPHHHDPDQPDQDQPDLDQFAARFGITSDDADAVDTDTPDTVPTSGGLVSTVTDGARSLLGVVHDVVSPVADRVQAKVRQTLDERRSLAGRVEELEAQVAALSNQQDDR